MFPLGDESRSVRMAPVATIGIIAANVLVFLLEIIQGGTFVERWAAVPANIAAGHDLITLFTSMFLHASWSHILGNMVFLWAFGPEIEDQMGSLRYVAFYAVGGMVAMIVEIAAAPSVTIPGLGASGAIAAVMGAFLVTFPRDRIRTIIFFGFFARIALVPAAVLIGFWFLLQLVEVGTVAGAEAQGGVAYFAHIGGLIFGAVLGRLFEL